MKNFERFIIYDSWLAKLIIPGFKYIMLFGFVLTKSGKENFKEPDRAHEGTHCLQYWDCFLFIGLPLLAVILGILLGFKIYSWWLTLTILIPPLVYYVWYGVNWLYQLITIGFNHSAYRNIIFERQAYSVEEEYKLLEENERTEYKHFSWLKY